MAAATICSDFGAQKNKVSYCFHCFPIYFPWSDGPDAMILVFWMLSFLFLPVFVYPVSAYQNVNSKTAWTMYFLSCMIKLVICQRKIKNLPAMQETQVWSLGREDPLEEGMATYSSILAWRIPWTEEPGRQHSVKESDISEWLTLLLLL